MYKLANLVPVAPISCVLSALASILLAIVVDASAIVILVAVALSSIPVDANAIVPPSTLLPDTLGLCAYILHD